MRTSFLQSRRFGALVVATSLVLATACDKGEETEQPEPAPAPAEPEPAPAEPAKVLPEPPAPTEPRPVNFPELQKFELPNKMQVIVVENHEVPIVDVQLSFNVGDVHDELLATMTASMLTEGTKKRPKAKIDAEIEQVGSSLSAFSGTHESVITTRVLKPNLKMALGLAADVARNPKFEQEALDKLKEQQKSALKQAKSSGQALGETLLFNLLYPEGHPYGRPFLTEAEIDGVTPEQLAEFHSTWYAPNNARLVLSGDITKDEAEKLAKKVFGPWKPRMEDFPPYPLDKFGGADYQKVLPKEFTVHIVDRKSASTEIFMGNLSLARNDANWEKMMVVNRIFGSGASSRLFQDIRETKRLTYNVNAFIQPAKAVGAFYIATQTKEVDQMMNALFEQIDWIHGKSNQPGHEADPSEKEFEDAVNGVAQSFPLGIETASQVAGRVGTQLTFGLADDYWGSYRDKIAATKRDEVKEIAAKYIHPVPVIVMVGRAKKIKKQLADVPRLKDAKVIVYDTDLKPQG